MKVIDLLNKIANGEEVPKKIKWRGVDFCYEYNEKYEDYVNGIGCSLFRHDDIYTLTNMLNDEIEIIEEPQEHKIPEKIKIDNEDRIQALSTGNFVYKVNQPTKNIIYKINEIIDYLEENK